MSAPGKLLRVEVWDDLACNGGARLAILRPGDVLECVTTTVAGVEDTLALTVAYDAPAAAHLTDEGVIRVVYDTGADEWDEWRIEELGTSAGPRGRTRTVLGVSPLVDLARCGLLRGQTTGTVPVLSEGVVGLTLTELWDQIIAPDLTRLGVSYFDVGTVDVSDTVTLSWEWASPLEVWRAAIAAVPPDTDGHEATLYLRRDGVTGYLLDVYRPADDTLATADLRARKNLRDLTLTRDAKGYATVLYGKGMDGGTIGDARWLVSDVTGSVVTLSDPLGGPGPVVAADQLNGCGLELGSVTATGIAYTDYAFQHPATYGGTGTIGIGTITVADSGDRAELAVGDAVSPNPGVVRASRITAIDDDTGVVTMATPLQGNVWPTSGTLTRVGARWATITGSDPGDGTFSTVTVDDASGITEGEWVRVAEDTAGTQMVALSHPAHLALYGRREGVVEREDLPTIANLIPNAFLGTWTTAGDPPDGWTTSGGSLTTTRLSDGTFSPYRWQLTRTGSTQPAWAVSPESAWVDVSDDYPYVVVKAKAVIAPGAGNNGNTFALSLVDEDGFEVGLAVSETRIGPVELTARIAVPQPGRYAVRCGKPVTAAPETVDITIEAVQLTAGVAASTGEDVPWVYGPAANKLWQAVNRALLVGSTPPVTYEVAVDDLTRYDPATWPHDALAVGAPARLTDASLAVADTLRIVRTEVDHLVARRTKLTLGSLRPTLTDLLSRGTTGGGLQPTGQAPIVNGAPAPVLGGQPTTGGGGTTTVVSPVIPVPFLGPGTETDLGAIPSTAAEWATEVRMRVSPGGTPFLTGRVETAGPSGSRLVAYYFDSDGDPQPIGQDANGDDGPWLPLDEVGDIVGAPVAAYATARTNVWVTLYVEGGDDLTAAGVGHVFLHTNTPAGDTAAPTDPTIDQPEAPYRLTADRTTVTADDTTHTADEA